MSLSFQKNLIPAPTVNDPQAPQGIKKITDRTTALISLSQLKIQNGQQTTFKKILSLLPLEKLPIETTDSLLIMYITTAARYNQTWVVNDIFESWKRTFPDDLKISFMTNLFLHPILNNKLLSFVAGNREKKTFVEIITELIKFDSNTQVKMACAKALQIYGKQTKYIYQVLFDVSQGINSQVNDFFKYQLSLVNDFQKKPVWIQDDLIRRINKGIITQIAGNIKMPTESAILAMLPPVKNVINIPPFSELTSILIQKYGNSGMTQEDKERALKMMTAVIQASTPAQRLKILNPDLLIDVRNTHILADEERDRKIFNILGPANPLIDAVAEEMVYGGERMFVSYVYDNDNDDDEFVDIVDWFTGSCQQCLKRIMKRWYAVRMPRPPGGWKGCYCSWKCVRDHLNDFFKPEMATYIMIDVFEGQIKEFKIQDRVQDPDSKPMTIEQLNAKIDALVPEEIEQGEIDLGDIPTTSSVSGVLPFTPPTIPFTQPVISVTPLYVSPPLLPPLLPTSTQIKFPILPPE